jgi:hypothetical protein
MTRVYGRTACSLWDEDDDFAALSMGAQRTYLMLSHQRDISACGMLPLTLRRWAQRIREDERAGLQGWLDELVAGRFIVVDEDTEELLVRTFVKWDGGATNPKRVLAIVAAAKAVRSRALRAVLGPELARMNIEVPFDCPIVAAQPVPDIPAGQPPTDTVPIAYPEATDSLLESPTALIPHPSSFILQPTPAPTRSAESLFEEFWSHYPKHVGKDAALRRWKTLLAKRGAGAVRAEDIIAGAERYANDPNLPEKRFVPNPATWLNGGHWADEPCPPRAAGGRSRPVAEQARTTLTVAARMQARADAAAAATLTPSYRTAINA